MFETYVINKQSLNKMSAQMLIVKIVSKKTENLWRADVNIAILQIAFSLIRYQVFEYNNVQEEWQKLLNYTTD